MLNLLLPIKDSENDDIIRRQANLVIEYCHPFF